AQNPKCKLIFTRAVIVVTDYCTREREEIHLKRVTCAPEFHFVMRIRGINENAHKPRKILQLLCLLQINGVFVKVTNTCIVSPPMRRAFETIGLALTTLGTRDYEPNLKSVHELIYKRGHGKVNKSHIPHNNAVIEAMLGKHDILSVEDLVHEIFTAGPNFRQAHSVQFSCSNYKC
ncbi:hypothetical protein K439DRAFT_1567691, partial [Ramaria rubella]